MKLQILTTTVLLMVASSTSVGFSAIAAPLSRQLTTQLATHPDDTALHSVSSIATDDGVSYQKQSAERDRQRQEELRRRERDRQREAEQRQRDRNSDDRDDDDDAPWWSSDEGWDERDRDRQRDARQREQDRRDLEERLEDRRDRDRDRDDDYDDRYDDRYDDHYDDRDDSWQQWERQQELLQWQWNNWRSSVPSSFVSSTRVDLTSLSPEAVTVAIDSVNGEQALTFAGNHTQQTINLAPGTYRVRFSSQQGDRVWQSGYLNVGRTDALRIVFDPQQNAVQVYNDPYAWTSDSRTVSSYEY